MLSLLNFYKKYIFEDKHIQSYKLINFLEAKSQVTSVENFINNSKTFNNKEKCVIESIEEFNKEYTLNEFTKLSLNNYKGSLEYILNNNQQKNNINLLSYQGNFVNVKNEKKKMCIGIITYYISEDKTLKIYSLNIRKNISNDTEVIGKIFDLIQEYYDNKIEKIIYKVENKSEDIFDKEYKLTDFGFELQSEKDRIYYKQQKELTTISLLDAYFKDEIDQSEQLEEKIFKANTPMIYAFITPQIKNANAIKVGFTDQGVQKRINQWKKYYKDIQIIGYWTSREFRKAADGLNTMVFFKDYPVHNNIIKMGYSRLLDDSFKYQAEDGSLKTLHVSKEFFDKVSTISGQAELSKEILEGIIIEMKKSIKDGTSEFKVYQLTESGTTKDNDEKLGPFNDFNPTPLQEKCIKEGIKAYKRGDSDLLMAAVMRFGKTYATYKIIQGAGIKYTLVTSAIADTKNAWRDDVNHKDFIDDFVFIMFHEGKIKIVERGAENSMWIQSWEGDSLEGLVKQKQKENKTIIIYCTLQDLSGTHGNIKDKHKFLFSNPPELLVVDETHYGSHSPLWGTLTGLNPKEQEKKVKEALKQTGQENDYSKEDIQEIIKNEEESSEINKQITALKPKCVLQCSGTPYYILSSGEFAESISKKTIITKVTYSDMVTERDKWSEENPGEDEWKSPYFGIPDIHKYGLQLTRKCRNVLKHEGKTSSMKALFEVSNNTFVHEAAIQELFEYLFKGNGKKEGFLESNNLRDQEIFKHTIVVLPQIKMAQVLEKLLKSKNIVDENTREISNIVGKHTTDNQKNVNGLNKWMKECEDKGKRTLTITVKRFLTGVSMPLVDSMIFMKDLSSPQEYDQNIFRLCTRNVGKAIDEETGEEIKVNRKHNVYLIDFSIDRIYNMTIESAIAQCAADGHVDPDSIKKRINKMAEVMPIMVDDTGRNDVLEKMHEIKPEDLLKKYINYNKDRDIEQIIRNYINVKAFDEFLTNHSNLSLLTDFKESSLDTMDSNNDGEDEVDSSNNSSENDSENDGGENDETSKKTEKNNSKAKDNTESVLKAKFIGFIQGILYINCCLDDPCDSVEKFLEQSKDNKEIEAALGSFINTKKNKLNILKDVYDKLNALEKANINFMMYTIQKQMNDTSISPTERFETAIKKLGRLGKSEVVTPKEIVDKMINKLDDDVYRNAESILLVNEKQCEFFYEIYKRFGKETAKKCKIIPSSETGKLLCKKLLKTIDLNDYINDIIVHMEDYNKDGKIDVKDFLDMTEQDLEKTTGKKHFDICLMNPPYSGDIDMEMLEQVYNISNKSVVVHPSSMYIKVINEENITPKNTKIIKLKDNIAKHIKSVDIKNYNRLFNISMKFPCAITYIDRNKKETDNIEFNLFNERHTVKSIYDINLVGENELIQSILNKINCEKITKHKYKDGDNYSENDWFCKYAGLGRSICADPRSSDVWYRNGLFAYYYWNAFDDRPPKNIDNKPIKDLSNGSTYNNPKYKNTSSNNLIGTKTEIENYKYNVFNTNLFAFINIIFTISSNNGSVNYLPWLVDKKYTNKEIYHKFNFSKEEIELIENTIKKYQKDSDWYKEYMYGSK